MKLIIGLGNPGKSYANTRHNIGFAVADKIAEKKEINFPEKPSFESILVNFSSGPDNIKLAKPQTYMNESGRSVKKIKNFYKINNENIWVISDDVDLALGKIKIQFDGSSAGHKGIQSIIDIIGNDFWRIRVGVGRSEKLPTDVWVLQKFPKSDLEKVEKITDYLADYLIKEIDGKITIETLTIE